MTHAPTWREYYDSEYLKGDALPPEGRTFTITDKSRDEVEGKDGKEHKLALTLTGGVRFLVNVTNATYMARLFGSIYPADWVGRAVTLQFDPTIKFGSDTVGGIRVIGSPELTEPLTFQFQENSRKKPRKVTLVPTPTPQHTAPATGTAKNDAVTTGAECGANTAPDAGNGLFGGDDD